MKGTHGPCPPAFAPFGEAQGSNNVSILHHRKRWVARQECCRGLIFLPVRRSTSPSSIHHSPLISDL